MRTRTLSTVWAVGDDVPCLLTAKILNRAASLTAHKSMHSVTVSDWPIFWQMGVCAGCQLLAAILAHDLETLHVLPRKSLGLVVSGRCLPLGGRSGPAVDDVLAS